MIVLTWSLCGITLETMLPYIFVNVMRIAGCRNENQHFLKLRSPLGLLLWLLITASYSHLLQNHNQRDFLFIHHGAPYKANSWLVQTSSPHCGDDVQEFMLKLRLFVLSLLLSGAQSLCMLVLRTALHQHSIVVVGVFFHTGSKIWQSSCFSHLSCPKLRVFVSLLHLCLLLFTCFTPYLAP